MGIVSEPYFSSHDAWPRRAVSSEVPLPLETEACFSAGALPLYGHSRVLQLSRVAPVSFLGVKKTTPSSVFEVEQMRSKMIKKIIEALFVTLVTRYT